MNKKKFAFDWGNSLESNNSLRQLARDLYAAGHEVHLIPACGETPSDEVYSIWMHMIGVPYTGIHRVIVNDSMSSEYKGGLKANKMKELGCHIIYDDSQANCDAVRCQGMEAVLITGDHPVPQPSELVK